METELSLISTLLSRASREHVYRCLLALHGLNRSDSCTLFFPLKAGKSQGTAAKRFYTLGRQRLAIPPLQLYLLRYHKQKGKEKGHRIYLFFGVKGGVLLTEPMQSTAHSVCKNLLFHLLPNTISPIRNGAARESGRE